MRARSALLLAVLLLSSPALCPAEIYKYVDREGAVHVVSRVDQLPPEVRQSGSYETVGAVRPMKTIEEGGGYVEPMSDPWGDIDRLEKKDTDREKRLARYRKRLAEIEEAEAYHRARIRFINDHSDLWRYSDRRRAKHQHWVAIEALSKRRRSLFREAEAAGITPKEIRKH